ncbi:C-type lectin domain family 2 member D-like isoform X1 [Alligator sinensis]|uniref:C-type lectin domain family 2 member D-like isoform X1 n=1 Tax=Alligator sinensis TaxID=38654 RepID=A0A3Q0FT92_ALLSI|nr:C-type lectin domain family 2 member D-like isoform X1 [Alligator sinensis]XP_025048918.1 C-type lectin domain family 2 member D-like isoform X1 [Alligator sinensis]XP_025048919.1 C-type lectin domain family 2 member D-like isoform X1 [Alligator sinensis]XP_025048920.1 C-type lectin domain family 2 member D-like isoform X1 [Alligator sinensis]
MCFAKEQQKERRMDASEKQQDLVSADLDVERKPGYVSVRGLRALSGCRVEVTVVLILVVLGLTAAVSALAVSGLTSHSQQQCPAWCPAGWIGYQRKCYYFSEIEKSWNESQRHCSSLGASLAMIDSQEDLAFMMRYKGIAEHWVGLWRGNEGQPWKWTNGTGFSHRFPIRGGGGCAYLNDKAVSSSRCTTERHWVCSLQSTRTADLEDTTQGSQVLKHL